MSARPFVRLPDARRAAVRRLAAVCVSALLGLGVVSAPASAAPARASAVTAAPSSASLAAVRMRSTIVREAARHLGKRYRWGATGPSSFDCSGFTSFVYRRVGVYLPHSSGGQSRSLRHVPAGSQQPGDLLFFRTRSGRVDHVGIYAGGNLMYAASQAAGRVKMQAIYGRYTVGRIG